MAMVLWQHAQALSLFLLLCQLVLLILRAHFVPPFFRFLPQAALALLRILFLAPYVHSYIHRRRLVYTFLPWAWEASNMAVITARLVFLLSSLVSFDPEYVLVLLSFLSVMLQAICLEHLRSSAPREKRIFLAGALNRVDASTRLLDCHHQHASNDDAAVCAGGSRAGRRSGGGGGGGGGGSAGELYDGHQQDVDLIATITAKMKVDDEGGRNFHLVF